MPKRKASFLAGLLLLTGVIVSLGGVARAAGEWEWTAGQGWMRGAGVARPTPKEQLHYAYELEKRSEFMDAARQYFLLVQNFPASEEAGIGLQRLARCLFEMENYYTSYKAIEQVIETYPNTGRMSDLVEIELRIAKKMMVSQTPDLLSGREERTREHNIRRSLEILDSVIEHDPYGPVAAEAYLVKGEAHMFINEVAAARKAFEMVRDEFPRSDYVERARLGILTADSLMGQARPQEVQEQIEVVREMERERSAGREPEDYEDMEEIDDVEGTIRQLAEVEAGKMMEQAEQYRRMSTRKGVTSSEFLYKEIVRRYPGTPQAEEAMARLGSISIPRESSRLTSAIRKINLNPFSYTKDPEPPWIVPQMAPEDMVMVDAGLGPIAGVPETGDAPRTSYSPNVLPAAAEASVGMGRSGAGPAPRNYTPITQAPGPAPTFIDGVADKRTYSSDPAFEEERRGGRRQQRQPQRPANPLPTITDEDLIAPGGMTRDSATRNQNVNVSGPPAFPGDDYYAVNTSYGNENPLRAPGMSNPSLGSPASIPYSDLIGAPPPQQGGYAPQQQQEYYDPYGEDRPRQRSAQRNTNNNGWSFGDDLR